MHSHTCTHIHAHISRRPEFPALNYSVFIGWIHRYSYTYVHTYLHANTHMYIAPIPRRPDFLALNYSVTIACIPSVICSCPAKTNVYVHVYISTCVYIPICIHTHVPPSLAYQGSSILDLQKKVCMFICMFKYTCMVTHMYIHDISDGSIDTEFLQLQLAFILVYIHT
jgi:hypothetical protein